MSERLAWVDKEAGRSVRRLFPRTNRDNTNLNKGIAKETEKEIDWRHWWVCIREKKESIMTEVFSIQGWHMVENRKGNPKLRQKVIVSVLVMRS